VGILTMLVGHQTGVGIAVNLQDVIWAIALGGMGLVALGFIHVIIQAGKSADDEARARSARTARRLQVGLFGVLLVIFLAGSWATLRRFPIAPQHRELDVQQVVMVVGSQFSWRIDSATVRAGATVEFRVTSTDVNHGFAIYAPDGYIVAQTQAMPGYTNKLLYTFTEPGTYTVHCLEYCGLGHSPMTATIQVVPARSE
jgi:cytochrome c oxidase subunit 2